MKKEVRDHLGNIYETEKHMCDKYNIPHSTFYGRYYKLHWTLEDALTRPVKKGHCKKQTGVSWVLKETEPDEFIVMSNYPKQEFLRYMEHYNARLEKNLDKVEKSVKSAIISKIAENKKMLDKVNANIFLYSVMDMIYAGEEEVAQNMCDDKTYRLCHAMLKNPNDMVKEIYVDFVNCFLRGSETVVPMN